MFSRRATFAAAIVLSAAPAVPVAAEPASVHPANKTLRIIRVDRAPAIDGRLDDEAWASADFVSDFLQSSPVEGGQPSHETRVALAYDDDALYVAADMATGGLHDLEAPVTRRDDTGTAERIIVSLDTFRDRRTAYSFAVTAAGVRADWFHPDDATFPRDSSFDPVWDAHVQRHADRWTAEMRIPFSQLRFPARGSERWGINLNRYIPQRNEDIFWIVVPSSASGWSSYFGDLEGLTEVAPPLRLELLPYAAGDATITSSSLVDDRDPFADEVDIGARAGIDAKLGLGPNLTLDATINPDFGQVEADPAVVNLTAFETVFDERRPFFVEGSQLLQTEGRAYFYSRRIGAAPRGSVEGDFVDIPRSTRILGAAKLTGRLPSRLSIGALTALTAPTDARSYDLASDVISTVQVEPLTTINVLRVQQELGRYSSRVGATLTSVYRNLSEDALANQLARTATTGGGDWNLRFLRATHELSGHVGFSAVTGEPAAISLLQQNSTHLFQRPDQDHVELDPDRSSLAGWTANLAGRRRSGRWRWSAIGTAESPGFDINDAGLLLSADDLALESNAGYQQTTPGLHHREWKVDLAHVEEWNFGGDRHPAGNFLSASWTFPNFWSVAGNAGLVMPGVDDTLTRGGPLTGIGWGGGGALSLSSPFSARTRFSLSFEVAAHQTGSSGGTTRAELTLRPHDRLQLSLVGRWLRASDNRQFIATIEDSGGPTFGDRFVFATVARREASIQTRVQVAVHPDLTLELYAEPFASSGQFSRFGELPESGSRDLREYGDAITLTGDQYTVVDGASSFSFDDPDFTVLSLRSTLVVRWEFLPGSTLFAVWQQDRSDRLTFADRRTFRALGDSALSAGAHVVALKLSYWWSAAN